MAVSQLPPDEDGARKGSALIHGAAAVQLVHAHELDDINEGDALLLIPSRNSYNPSPESVVYHTIPYGMVYCLPP